MKPAPELLDLLAGAYPCPAFSGVCQCMRWAPEKGHIPRGFLGASGEPSEVEIVLVFAEPGDPQPGDHETLEEALAHAYRSFKSGTGVFHQKARAFFNLCWPGLSFDDQLKRVWVTESVLCSAEWSTGPVPREIENECGLRYLKQQLALFPNALVVALGSKAQSRLSRIGVQNVEKAHAFGLPGCNQKEALPSWIRVAEMLIGKTPAQAAPQVTPRKIVIAPAALAPAPEPPREPAKRRLWEGKHDMPASYVGDALHGGTKVDGVNYIVGTMLEHGSRMGAIRQRLIDLGRSEKAARMHLMFLHKNGVVILVNGNEYQKGQPLSSDDYISIRS